MANRLQSTQTLIYYFTTRECFLFISLTCSFKNAKTFWTQVLFRPLFLITKLRMNLWYVQTLLIISIKLCEVDMITYKALNLRVDYFLCYYSFRKIIDTVYIRTWKEFYCKGQIENVLKDVPFTPNRVPAMCRFEIVLYLRNLIIWLDDLFKLLSVDTLSSLFLRYQF